MGWVAPAFATLPPSFEAQFSPDTFEKPVAWPWLLDQVQDQVVSKPWIYIVGWLPWFDLLKRMSSQEFKNPLRFCSLLS